MDTLTRGEINLPSQHDETLVERLVHIDRLSLLGEMASSFAHEVNQPLTAIATYARAASRMLASGSMDPQKLAGVLDEISEQALRAGDCIARMRALTPSAAAQRSPVSCNVTIREICGLMAPEFKRTGTEIALDLAEPLPLVEADPLHIHQVLINLLRNALDAQKDWTEHRRVRISSAVGANGDVIVKIWNTGSKIAPQNADMMFHPFFSTKAQGTGLGLNISRSLLRAHGGDLHYSRDSEPGTTFSFSLPTR